jgi:hypothetical protein
MVDGPAVWDREGRVGVARDEWLGEAMVGSGVRRWEIVVRR